MSFLIHLFTDYSKCYFLADFLKMSTWRFYFYSEGRNFLLGVEAIEKIFYSTRSAFINKFITRFDQSIKK
jgi:hypothetical protein